MPSHDEEAKLLEGESFELEPFEHAPLPKRSQRRFYVIMGVSVLLVLLLASALAVDRGKTIAKAWDAFQAYRQSEDAATSETQDEDESEDLPQEDDGVLIAPELLEAVEGPSLLSTLAPDGFLDTKPPLPAHLLADTTQNQKYLAFIPHSGFHNERGELTNALMIAHLLGRVLVVPDVRLGSAMPWDDKGALEAKYAQSQKSAALIATCRPRLPEVERMHRGGKYNGPQRCLRYSTYIESSWTFLVNMSALPVDVKVVPRTDYSPAFFTKPTSEGGLGLDASQIYNISDTARYDARVYELRADGGRLGKYQQRIDIEDLKELPQDLIYFGSLFGGGRLRVTSDPSKALLLNLWNSLIFNNPFLDKISNQVAHMLGGRDEFVGVHLRVGDGPFQTHAPTNMPTVFRRVCNRLGLSNAQVSELVRDNSQVKPARRSLVYSRQPQKDFSLTDQLSEADFQPLTGRMGKRQASKAEPLKTIKSPADLLISRSLKCRGSLYTDPKLQGLNRPVYIATDSHKPLSDPNLAVFFNSLPCVFILTDFAEVTPVSSQPIPDLAQMVDLRNSQDGVRLGPLLFPFLEAEIIARSRVATIGTPGSTFSGYASHQLHDYYAAHKDDFEPVSWQDDSSGDRSPA